MKLCSIASGSSGNCIYVGSTETNFLIDAGVSGKKIAEGLESIGVNPERLDGIFVTHEHSDHIQGIGILARKYNVPIYATVETVNSFLKEKAVGRIPQELIKYVKADEEIVIKDMVITPFSTSHDSANSVCYSFKSNGKKVGMATDLGVYTDYTVEHLKDSDILYLEANHDVNMLLAGRYPYYLKQRILGEKGHLSNDSAAELIVRLLTERLKHIVLGHLSRDNNYPELAYETVRVEIEKNLGGMAKPAIMVANRDVPSLFITV